MSKALDHPEPTLQTTALRYAAGDLTPAEATAFEAQLAENQEAREALSEAVRLSAAALGQAPPTPDRTFRAAIRERLAGWCPRWLSRRAYRGHPLAWASLGAVAVAVCAVVGISLAQREPAGTAQVQPIPVVNLNDSQPAPPTPPEAPLPREAEVFASTTVPMPATCSDNGQSLSIAELWAQMSTPDHVEKTHDEEVRWRQKLHNTNPTTPKAGHTATDTRE